MALNMLFDVIYTTVAPFFVEFSFMLFFGLGYLLLRVDPLKKRGKSGKQQDGGEALVKPFEPRLKKNIETEAAANNSKAVLAAWREGKDKAPTPAALLKPVVQAFLDVEPENLIKEVAAHMRAHTTALGDTSSATAVLDVVARSGQVGLMAELWEVLRTSLKIPPAYHIFEVLLGGYASVGDEKKVEETMSHVRSCHLKMTARGHSLIVKGFLKNNLVDAVSRQITAMLRQGFHVPTFAVTQFCRIAVDAGRGMAMFSQIKEDLVVPAEALSFLLEDCARRNDLESGKCIESYAREKKMPLMSSGYDALLKLYTLAGDLRALQLFEDMQSQDIRITEGLCVGLLARCAETKFLRFAELIVKFVRAREGMTIGVYSALMKVYAYSGMYDKACDLYDQIRNDGLEPDAMMYGCLMKFSVECGRTALSQQLSEKAPALDIQNYMSLIRAAGRDKDVDRAFGVLAKLKASGVQLDIAAYNCVLDVCVSAGNMPRARELLEEMRRVTSLDIISYNTLMKGYCHTGDLKAAKGLLQEMTKAGLKPNDVSYNCLINAAVSKCNGDFREAWEIIEMMEMNGIAVDHYTISIMMKSMKRVKSPQDVSKVLALLDRTGVDVCSDEILLNTVLETCIRHKECRRLESILSKYAKSNMWASVHTYGSLIKACSTLRRVDRCRQLWQEMASDRGMEPNEIVLGCMLDALVCNNEIEEAVDLLKRWKQRVPPNTVMYSTIIKGFANTHQAERAMKVAREMRQDGIQMNTVVYNSLIDAQARVGAMDSVTELVGAMADDGCQLDAITNSTIVKGYCVKGDLDKAFEVFRNMQSKNMVRDSIIYNTILDGCTRHGRFDLADRLLEDMEHFQVVPSNFTVGILVKMWGRRRQLDKAFSAMVDLPKRYGFVANAQVKTCLMCACLNNGAIDRAFTVFEGLKSEHLADSKAYGALISGCARNGELKKAVSLVDEAYGLNGGSAQVQLETEPLEALLNSFSQRGLMPTEGVTFLERLRAAKVPVSTRLFAYMFDNERPSGGKSTGAFGANRGQKKKAWHA